MSKKNQTNLEADKVTPYLASLFALLSTATLFDGFDSAMLSFAAPDVRATLGISRDEWGMVSGLTRMGVMVSFVFLLSADHLGRRTVMMITIVGFAVANGLTAFVTSTEGFVIAQFFARIFLTAEYALAVIMIGEEYPARLRGRAIAVLTSLSTAGVMLMAKVQPYVLVPEGEDGGWLHHLGLDLVRFGQDFFGMAIQTESWRALYVLGAIPLVLVIVLRFSIRETRRFEHSQEQKENSKSDEPAWRRHWRDARRPWDPRYRGRTAIVALLWNCVHIVTAPSVVYWVIFAREDLGLTTTQVGDIVFWGYGGGVAGHFVAGWLIDSIGRKRTCAGFYVAAAISIFWLYHHPTLFGQYFWMVSTVFCFGAAMTATHVYASELFPTEIRATGYGWTTNFLGRITEVITPMAIGALLIPLNDDIPAAIAVVAVGPILGAIAVLRYAPETQGLTLEQVQDHFDQENAAEKALD
ncbi:MAG: MFS transporter [Myxococcota bacterium]|jgi:MFS transporter, putative metabolite:H+ symporter|nr:MFS transporter [Myxococcota bacterium]